MTFTTGWVYSNSQAFGLSRFFEQVIARELRFGGGERWQSDMKPTTERLATLGKSIVVWTGHDGEALVSVGRGLALITWTPGSTNMYAWIAAPTLEDANSTRAAVRDAFPDTTMEEGQVEADFWFHTPNGPQNVSRKIDVPLWNDIQGNYGRDVRAELERVMFHWQPGNGGRLLLWTGQVGTGKTFALRALACEWRSWCRLSYITDPEEFFGKASYMMAALLSENSRETPVTRPVTTAEPVGTPKWNLVVLEDCGEMLSRDAKERVGPSLGRLLNLTDGLIGQGLRVLVLITTNEESGALHDAVVRPGRCASQAIFKPLDMKDARQWREAHGIDVGDGLGIRSGATLAQLFAEVEGWQRPREKVVGFRQ